MILVAALLAAAPPPPLSLDPFMDEEAAANALDAQMICVGTEVFNRRSDTRLAEAVSADVVKACSKKTAALRSALADVYRRKPILLPIGKNPDQAAAAYVDELDARVQLVVQDARKKK